MQMLHLVISDLWTSAEYHNNFMEKMCPKIIGQHTSIDTFIDTYNSSL